MANPPTDSVGSPHPLARATLFENNHFLVIDKPAGVLSQGDHSGAANIVDLLRDLWNRPFVGLVHRLDRDTTGVMIVAKRSKCAERLSDQIVRGALKKTYLAWVEGLLPLREDAAPVTLEHWLIKDEKSNRVRVVSAGTRESKRAVLQFEAIALDAAKNRSLARITLLSGRSHQIRAQFGAIGHPLVGDTKYGGSRSFPRPALHAVSLQIEPVVKSSAATPEHPTYFWCLPPDDFLDLHSHPLQIRKELEDRFRSPRE